MYITYMPTFTLQWAYLVFLLPGVERQAFIFYENDYEQSSCVSLAFYNPFYSFIRLPT